MFDNLFDKENSHEHIYFDIEEVQFNYKLGVCQLKSDKVESSQYNMIWSVVDYPMEKPIPGAPFPVKVVYSIERRPNKPHQSKILSGEFIYYINSGTLPQYNEMGLVAGSYTSYARYNKNNEVYRVVINTDMMELVISKHK